ncbi:hypothetical protein [Novosphingobium sp. fls2-241-R2A-195]|uniref:winged helix-turn-helix domain-containing protein n=1 Tax=Novosphingobium sp. fls2-241-R2A-195 TaxID=3040296 RepID=UPI00254EE464|nr:hypothetical protein [Novosphingobium sp. fls2-241-R2A-195]
MSHIPCPHCGGNTVTGTPVTRGKWWIGMTEVHYDQERIALPRNLVRVLYAIAWANGEAITHRDLPGTGEGTLATHIRALRRTFGDKLPVRNVPGRGYAWDTRA